VTSEERMTLYECKLIMDTHETKWVSLSCDSGNYIKDKNGFYQCEEEKEGILENYIKKPNYEHTITKNNSPNPTTTTTIDTSEILPIPTTTFDSKTTTSDSTTTNLLTTKPSSKILSTTTTTTTTTTTITNASRVTTTVAITTSNAIRIRFIPTKLIIPFVLHLVLIILYLLF